MMTESRACQATSIRMIATGAVALAVLLSAAGPARAQLACGDTIAPGSQVTVAGDIGPCGLPGPALRVQGPAKVNFNGFKLACGADITGIEIVGTKAEIKNGYVKNCRDGIDVAGDGKHKIFKMVVRSIRTSVGQRGFRVRSNKNRLSLNLAKRFNGEGFRIQGDQNRLTHNESVRNKQHGFRVDGDKNVIKSNFADANGTMENGGEGFRIDGDRNRIWGNKARDNKDEGFRIRDGQSNQFATNQSWQNGISDTEAGIRVQSYGNAIYVNKAHDNFGHGIHLTEDAKNNRIKTNDAHNNAGTGLVDDNLDPPCDANRWTDNSSDSRSQRCIR